MKRIILILLYACMFQAALPQGQFQAIIDSISINNKIIAASRQSVDMLKISSKTGLYLPNPSVSFDRLNSAAAGGYTEMIVSQSFDFPTVYLHRKKVSDLFSSQAEEQYRQSKSEILRTAARVYSELIYSNRKLLILSKRLRMALQLQEGVEKRLNSGDADIFETNRIRSELAFVKSELQLTENTRVTLSMKLTGLNGGIQVFVMDTLFPEISLNIITDTSINSIVNRNPEVRYWMAEQEIAQRTVGLQKSLSLPKFEVGYRQDVNTGNTFNGFHAGITIPLLENKNTVKAARARQEYANKAAGAIMFSFQNELEQLISEYMAVSRSLTEITTVFNTLGTPELLSKAYRSGHINYTEFFTGYENHQKTLLYIEELNQKRAALQMQLYVLSGL